MHLGCRKLAMNTRQKCRSLKKGYKKNHQKSRPWTHVGSSNIFCVVAKKNLKRLNILKKGQK